MTQRKASFLQVLGEAVEILAEFLPQKTYLYFPLIYNSLVWIAKRPAEWKKKIFSWQVWPDPAAVMLKTDEYVVSFFETREDLLHAFRDEIKDKNLDYLRQAFAVLYPLLGLEDPFLQGLFDDEIRAKKYREIIQDFESKIEQVHKDIEPLMGRPEGRRALIKLGEEFVLLGDTLLSKSKVKRAVKKLLASFLEENDE